MSVADGLAVLLILLTGIFDYWVWHSLLFVPETIGGYIGFTVLALISIPLTIFALILGFILIDEA